MKNHKVLVVGPMPPLVGGIASYLSNLLNSDFNGEYTLIPFSTNRPSKDNIPSSSAYNAIFSMPIIRLLKCIMLTIYHILKFPMILAKHNPSIIHIHTSSYLPFFENSIYVILAKLFKKIVILHVHSGEFDIFYRESPNMLKIYIYTIMNLSNKIICLSHYWKHIFKSQIGLTDKKLSIIYNGYSSSLFYPIDSKKCRNMLKLPTNKKIVLSVGNLLEIKGHKYLIDSMSKIANYRTDIVCFIIGDGILRNELENKIVNLELQNYVKLVGKIPHDDIPAWMNSSDLFIMPSINEGNPVAMLESLAVGLPFVGSKVGAIPDVIKSSDYGFLIEPKNADDLTKKIIEAIDKKWDPVLIATYAENYSWDNILLEIRDLYDSIFKENRFNI